MSGCSARCLGPDCERWAECQQFLLVSDPLYAGYNTWQYHFFIDENHR